MRWVIGFLLFGCLNLCFAGVQEDIAADMRASHWDAAAEKLQQVLGKHADNALAHYWLAQVRERQGQIGEAASELRLAKDWDPTLAFAGDRSVLSRLEARVGAQQTAEVAPNPAVAPPGVPTTRQMVTSASTAMSAEAEGRAKALLQTVFAWLLGLVAVGATVTVIISRRSARQSAAKAVELERARVRSRLDGVKEELRDAERAVRGRGASLGLEGQMSMEDRLKGGIEDADRAMGALPGLTTFDEQDALVSRLRRLAASGRGEAASWTVDQRRGETQRPVERVERTLVVKDDDSSSGFMPGLVGGRVMGMAQASGGQQRFSTIDDVVVAPAQPVWQAEPRRVRAAEPADGADVDVRGSGTGSWGGGSGGSTPREETREVVREDSKQSNDTSSDTVAAVDTAGAGASMD